MPIKGIIWGSAIGITLGVIAYLSIIMWLIFSIGPDNATGELIGSYIRSPTMYLLSFPISILLMIASGFIAAKKSQSNCYIAAFVISVIVCLSIRFGPLKLWSIYMNYIPIFAGTFLGVFTHNKLNKNKQPNA